VSGAPIGWGIAGTGAIAATVAPEFALVPGATIAAVGSRSAARAEDFAAEHGIPRPHGSYRGLVADPEVDVVYVATPHPQHHAIALAALRHGKAVLVEKSFTATLAGAREIVAEARSRGIFAMEAMWTRFLPAVVRLRELVAGGAIGDVVAVQADLGIDRPFDPGHRLFAAELGGGALLDLGVYVVSFAQMLLGAPSSVAAVGRRERNGVDAAATLLLGWPDGRSATLATSLHAPLPGAARVLGTAGWIEVPPRFHHPTGLVVHREGAEPEAVELAPLGTGYAHELVEVTECVRAGRRESDVMPLDDTLAVMAVLEEAGALLGVRWAEDATVDV
jgi:predicted dehydrogenase